MNDKLLSENRAPGFITRILTPAIRRYFNLTVFVGVQILLIIAGCFLAESFFLWSVVGGVSAFCFLLLSLVGYINNEEHRTTMGRFALFTLSLIAIVLWVLTCLRFKSTTRPNESFAASDMEAYFEKIRNNDAQLTAFFECMPKGGDLHNHYMGAVYAESFWQAVVDQKYHFNLKTYAIKKKATEKDWIRIDTVSDAKLTADIKQHLFQEWSAKDYYDAYRPSDKHFFDAFSKFPKDEETRTTNRNLLELKKRAEAENVSYIELMLGAPKSPVENADTKSKDELFRSTIASGDTTALDKLLEDAFYNYHSIVVDSANAYIDSLRRIHFGIDDNRFTMRYIATIRRESPPFKVFINMMAAFEAANRDSFIVGVNILNREDGELSMKDYELHMKMFRFLRKYFPNVKCSLHAGELAMGSVRPEDLTWHISEAVFTAGAKRIGHGVDMAYENNSDSILNYMRNNKIAIEINLISNEFILKVKDDAHPIMLYAQHKVPIVLCTDDPGILRTSLTAQYVALAKRYPAFKYADIKQIILNGIEFSFLSEGTKARLKTHLQVQLTTYERKVMASNRNLYKLTK